MKMSDQEHTNIRVIVRVRPNNRREMEQNQRTIIKVLDETSLLFDPDEDEDEFFFQGIKQTHRDITKRVNKKLNMEFDRVFNADSSNDNIFEESIKPLIASVMNGYNCSVFVYGATGAGKTFTMLGSEFYPGVTFLTMQELFANIENLGDKYKFDVGISYLEVYNENVMNLLTKTGPLKLREDSNGVVVSQLVLKPIHSAEELLMLLALGNKNRTQHPTDANSESSRSHAIFQVHIRMTEIKTSQKRIVKLSMIDLAGSERAASTKGLGTRFKEGASINKSLLALGNCINKLADGLKHIPYRDSNLTRILKDSLGGNCQTVMIANISPSSLTYEDTYNTLKYASRAKKIRTTLRQTIMKTNMPKDYYVKKLNEYQNENQRLNDKIKQLESRTLQTAKSFDDSELINWCSKIDSVYAATIKTQELYFNIKSKEKILKFKSAQKEYVETNKRILNLDEFKVNEYVPHLPSSANKYEKHIPKQKDIDSCLKRYHESLKDLEKLKEEIPEAKCSSFLLMYLKGKDAEMENFKTNIKLQHMNKINTMYSNETGDLRSKLLLGCEIIQNNYLILRANGLIDSNLKEQLKKMDHQNVGRCCVKFVDKDSDEQNDKLDYNSLSFESINKVPVDNMVLENSTKRAIKLEGNIVETNKRRAIDLEPEDNGNITFQIVPPESEQKYNNSEIIKNILSEHNVNSSNKVVLSKALVKSNITGSSLLTKVALGNKENKRFSPNRVRKSPRPSVRNVTSRTLSSAATFLSRHRTNSQTTSGHDTAHQPNVRINRTVSMRAKKILESR